MKLWVKIAVAAALACATPAVAQTTPPAAIEVPELDDSNFGVWTAKSNAYVDLLNGSLRALESLKRYHSWVDMQTGPTGKERNIYGLYSVDVAQANGVIGAARAAADGPPPIPPLDEAARAYAASFETLVPILNDATAYYERKDYADDKMAGGQALHAKIVPAMNAFLASRARLEGAQEELTAGLDRQGLALIEKREGRSQAWQLRNLGMTSKAALHALPRADNAEEMVAFNAALADYAQAVTEFDAFVKASGQYVQSNPSRLLAEFRTLREKIEKKEARPSDFNNIVAEYNSVVELNELLSLSVCLVAAGARAVARRSSATPVMCRYVSAASKRK